MRAQPEVLRWRAASEVQVQHHLPSRRDRWANMQTAWQRNPNVQLPKAVGILLVDDLLTSGATMASALRTLQQADPGRPVLGLTLVHVPWRQGAPIDAPTTRPTE
jgi:predicted amidophosphoribosyltransferase